MRYLFGVIGLLLIGVSYAQKGQKEAAQILFTVETVPVTKNEFLYLYRKNHQGKPDEFQEKKIREYLGLFINFKLKVAEARSRGLDTAKAFINEFNSYRDELRKPYVASSDELGRLVKEAYERLTVEVNASHILLMVPPDATPADTLGAYRRIDAIRKRILAGEPFEKLARELSEDPSAKQNAGSLGYFTAMQMVYPFENAAYRLNPGEVSGPVRTRFGYHLIKLFDKRPASGEVEVSHILLRGTDEKVKNKSFDICEQLKGGRKWEDLCSEYSEDPATKGSGGRLRVFGVGALASVPEFEAMAFSLQQPGDISDPFSSAMGWHIIRLEKKIPVPSFKDLEASLKRRIARDERLQLGQAAQLAKRKKDFSLVENEDTRSRLAALADSTLQKGDWRAVKESQHSTETLFTIQGNPVYVAEFFSYVKANLRPSASSPQACLQQLLDQFADRQIANLEDVKLQSENSEYRNLLNEYYEGILLFSIMEKEVWNKASEDTVGQRSFYEQNAIKYKAGERLSARIFATPDKPFLEEVKAKISKGDTLTAAEIKRFKSVGNYRAYEKGDNKAIDNVSWSIGMHETEADGMYYLVEVDRLIPSGIKRFEEARATVISDYQDQLEERWVAQLKKSHPVKVNKKLVKAVIAELVKK